MSSSPSSSTSRIQQLSDAIDAHFDAMMYPGMPRMLADQINQQRNAAHAQLRNQIMAEVLRS